MPKVTCICPTYNRAEYLPLAVSCFKSQTFTDAELLIVDDSERPNEDFLDFVYDARGIGVSYDERIRYVWLPRPQLPGGIHVPRMNVGAKRNYCCELAEGEIIAHWDDDDWYAPNRLEMQLWQMQLIGKPFVGHHSITYWDMERNWAFKFVQEAQHSLPYAAGTSMMYRKDYWEHVKFQPINKAEDSNFSEYGRARKHLASYDGTQLVVARAHADSTAPVYADQHACFPSAPLSEVPERFLRDIGVL